MRLTRKNIYEINIWPGFVDILGTLLIVTIFTVLISTITQIYFNDQLEVKRGEISTLDSQIDNLIGQLNLITSKKIDLENENSKLSRKIVTLEKEKNTLEKEKRELDKTISKKDYLLKISKKEKDTLVSEKGELLENLKERNTELNALSKKEEENSLEIFELNRNVEKLNKKLKDLANLLEIAEKEDKKNKIKIENMGKKLNQALAGKVQELTEYQSIFFRKIKEALGDREDIKVSGDRFILPSEIFFQSGSDILEEIGMQKLINVAESLEEISKKIPKKIDWILRIDGHTDKVPIQNEKFNSNWHLSSSRSINIVRFLISKGIAPNRLVAAGFGEFSPLIDENTEYAFEKNRRIEIKLTTR